MMLDSIHEAVKNGQGLNPEQAKYLLKSNEELLDSLKTLWRIEEREARARRKARKLLDAQVAQLKRIGMETSSLYVAKARDLLDHRKNSPRRP